MENSAKLPRPECPNSPPRLRLLNTQTGEVVKLNCKAYSCPVCGIRKKMQLQNALEKVLNDWKTVRMWTFTASSNNCTPTEHAEKMKLAWRKFTKYIRTSPILPNSIKTIQYVKVAELHKTGYLHFHILVDKFVSWDIFQTIWTQICAKVFQSETKCAHVNVIGTRYPKVAAKYVAKYVSKSAQSRDHTGKPDIDALIPTERFEFRLYSKSNKVILFPKTVLEEGEKFWKVVLTGTMAFLNLSSMAQVSVEVDQIEVEILSFELFEPPEQSKSAILAQIQY